MTTLADLTESQNETNEHLKHIEEKFDDFFRDTFNQRGEMLESKRESNATRTRFALPNVGKMLGKAADNSILKTMLGLAGLLTGLGALKSFLDNFDQYKNKFDTFIDGLLEGLDRYQVNMETFTNALAQTALGFGAGATAVKAARSNKTPTTAITNPPSRTGKTVTYQNSKGQVKTAQIVKELDNGKVQVKSGNATFAIDEAKNKMQVFNEPAKATPAPTPGGGTSSLSSKLLSGASKAFAVGGVALAGYEIGEIRSNENLSDREKNVQTAGAVGGALGGFGAGALAGAAAGTAIPIPVLGTLAGAIVGGLIGSYGGRAIGIEAADALLDPETAQALPNPQPIVTTTNNYNTTTAPTSSGTEDSRSSSGSVLDQWNTGVWSPYMIR